MRTFCYDLKHLLGGGGGDAEKKNNVIPTRTKAASAYYSRTKTNFHDPF